MEPSPGDQRSRPGRVHHVLLHLGCDGQRRAGQLRRRQRLSRRPRPAPCRPGSARAVPGVGRVGAGERHDGHAVRGRDAAHRGLRHAPAHGRAGPGPVRRRHDVGRAVPRPHRPGLGLRGHPDAGSRTPAAARSGQGHPANGRDRGRRGRYGGGAHPPAAGPGRGRARPVRGGARTDRGRRRSRPRLGQGDRGDAGLPQPGLRLADRRRTPQPPDHGHRSAPARHARLRLPHPRRPRAAHRQGAAGRARRREPPRRGCVGGGRGPGRHRRHGLPPARRRAFPRRPVAARPRRPGRHLRLPDRPRLGPGDPAHRRPRRPGPQREPRGRVPARRRRLRRRVLRHLAARGARHGPATATAAGNLLGGVRARRDRPGRPARQPDRRLRRHERPGLRRAGDELEGGRRRPRRHRPRRERRLRTRLLHLRPRRPGRHRRHGVLVVPRRPPLGRPGPAYRRVLARPRGRRHDDDHARQLHGLHRAGRPGPRRPVQDLLGHRGRHGVVRGRGHARPGAAVRRTPQRTPGPRGRAWLGDQPGRCVQRAHRPQWPLPAAGHPTGPRQRGPVDRRRRRGRGTRHGYAARRPDRGAGAPGHLRAGPAGGPPAAPGVGEVEHRPHPGGGRRRGRHQDGHGDAARSTAEDAAPRPALVPRGLVHGRGGAADRPEAVARGGPAVACGCLVVRHQRHERARHHRAGPAGRRAGRGAGRTGWARLRRDPVARLGEVGGRTGPAARAAVVPGRALPGGRGLLAGGGPVGLRAPRGAAGRRRRRRGRGGARRGDR